VLDGLSTLAQFEESSWLESIATTLGEEPHSRAEQYRLDLDLNDPEVNHLMEYTHLKQLNNRIKSYDMNVTLTTPNQFISAKCRDYNIAPVTIM
jgi:hypothetical protein